MESNLINAALLVLFICVIGIFYAALVIAKAVDNHADMVAFADHLDKVSIALHDLEWEWSRDYGMGDADPAIRVVVTATDEVSSSMKQVGELLAELEQVVVSAKAIAKKGTP